MPKKTISPKTKLKNEMGVRETQKKLHRDGPSKLKENGVFGEKDALTTFGGG